ncbi:RTA1 like protein-domain-containing protein [Biscogniauxia marginata]|nr:RTA1 like protein-domain-containing protein [Biscogniauxia marginata]
MSSGENSTAAGGKIPFDQCTPEICPYERSFYQYRLWLAPNVAFASLFAVSLLAYVGVYAFTRRGAVFTLAMVLGLICEIDGYVGRIMNWRDQWSSTGFIMQTTSLTFAPAFLAAGIYLCLRKIVRAFGPENSRIPPEYYTRVFIPCDVVCLLTQATGGTIAALAARNRKSTDTGDTVIMVGLALQVATLLAFIGLALDFALRTLRRRRALGSAAALDQSPALVAVRGSRAFRGFAAALALSTACVFARCVFRVVELSGGYAGPLIARQDLFVAFEGVMIGVAVAALNVFHPSLCFPDRRRRGGSSSGSAGRPKRVSVNSFEREFVGDSLGPCGFENPPKLSTSSSLDESVSSNAYAWQSSVPTRDLTRRPKA